jgi:hypothetical protein
MRTRWRHALLALLLSLLATPSFADEVADLRRLRDTTISLINQLVEKGVLTRAQADGMIAQAEQAGSTTAPLAPSAGASGAAPSAPAATAPAPAGEVRVPYIPEAVQQQITDQVKQDVLSQAKTERWGVPGALPDWLGHVSFNGDVRFRAQANRYPDDNTPNAPVAVLNYFGVNVTNSTTPDNFLRLRAHFGFEESPVDSVTIGVRLASGGVGAGTNAASESQTLGNYGSRESVGLDRAYLAYRPLSWTTLTFARLGNPFFAPTSLVWAPNDVSLEGATLAVNPQLTRNLSLFSTAGLFPIQNNHPAPGSLAPSKWLYAYQAGLELHPGDAADLKAGAAYYDYQHLGGTPNPTIYSTQYTDTAAPFRQTGNTVFDINGLLNSEQGTQNYLWGLASQFRELNLSASLDLPFLGSTHAIIDGDYVRNLGFNQAEILARTGYLVRPQTTGWQSALTVGHPTLHERNSWQAFLGYRYVQRDATLDAFTDADFHYGGTDAQGYYFGAAFAFATNTTVRFRWMEAKQIDGVELAGADSVLSSLPLAINIGQLDIESSF